MPHSRATRSVVLVPLTVLLLMAALAGGRVALQGPSWLDPAPVVAGAVPAGAPAKLAFAHYFTPYNMSDNKPEASDYWTTQWLNPMGENGKHKAYGGFVRDRPLPRAPISGDYQFLDMQTEVRQAKAAGLNGFTVDLLSLSSSSYNYTRADRMLDAAAAVDPSFKIMLMPDMKALAAKDANTIAAGVAHFAQKKAAFRLSDGRLVLSPFWAEGHTASWWSGVLNTLKSRYGISTAFVPTFLDWRTAASSFAPISYGFSRWGERNPRGNVNAERDARDAHAMGKLWMQPVSVQDERPNQGVYDEAGNTETLRESWTAAYQGDAEWVQVLTWNDYSEGTTIAPSKQHGYTYLDLGKRYLTRWRTGAFPAITKDTLFLSHRKQMYTAMPSFPQTKFMNLRKGSTPSRNTVEVVSELTAPATVTVNIGGARTSWAAPAGESVKLVPLGYGTISATSVRGGVTTATVQTPSPAVAKPYTQDLQYVAAESK